MTVPVEPLVELSFEEVSSDDVSLDDDVPDVVSSVEVDVVDVLVVFDVAELVLATPDMKPMVRTPAAAAARDAAVVARRVRGSGLVMRTTIVVGGSGPPQRNIKPFLTPDRWLMSAVTAGQAAVSPQRRPMPSQRG